MISNARIILTVTALLTVALPSEAQIPIPAAPGISARGYILVDHHSNEILAARNENQPLEPASITKLMTAYTTFRALREGQIHLQDRVLVSEKAWRTPGSRMFIEVNTRVTVEELLQGMIVQSGNDASVALAEYLAGSEAAFVQIMNRNAAELDMTNTQYRNSTGLPAEGHLTTAADIARLANAIVKEFPEYYAWYSQREFTYNGITQKNRNALLWRDPTVDGMKTGMTEAAGYCLVSSARRDDMRLVAVVLGTKSTTARANDSQTLLNYGFRFFETRLVYPAGDSVTEARIWKGASETAALGVPSDVYVTIPRGSYAQLEAQLDLPAQLTAPLDSGTELGTLRINLAQETLAETNVIALNTIAQGSLWQRARDSVLLLFE